MPRKRKVRRKSPAPRKRKKQVRSRAKKKRRPAPLIRRRKKRTRQLTNTLAVERIRGFTKRVIPLTAESARDYLTLALKKVRRHFSRKEADRWGANLYIRWKQGDHNNMMRTQGRVAREAEEAIEKLAEAVDEPGPTRESDDPLTSFIVGFRFDKYVARQVKRKIYRRPKKDRGRRG